MSNTIYERLVQNLKDEPGSPIAKFNFIESKGFDCTVKQSKDGNEHLFLLENGKDAEVLHRIMNELNPESNDIFLGEEEIDDWLDYLKEKY